MGSAATDQWSAERTARSTRTAAEDRVAHANTSYSLAPISPSGNGNETRPTASPKAHPPTKPATTSSVNGSHGKLFSALYARNSVNSVCSKKAKTLTSAHQFATTSNHCSPRAGPSHICIAPTTIARLRMTSTATNRTPAGRRPNEAIQHDKTRAPNASNEFGKP